MEQQAKEKRNYWKKEEEDLLKQWADKAQCYQWMHAKSHNIYSWKNALFTIPVIIISTITGTANFAQDRFGEDTRTYVVISIGTLSIIAGIITTIYQFLKIAELNEGHRVATLSWGKFYRTIKTELTRHPLDRMPPLELIKISRDEYDRLVELSPFMPVKVIKEFNSKFKKNDKLTKPEICDELKSTIVYEINEKERNNIINVLNHITDDPKENPQTLRKRKLLKKTLDDKTEKFKQTYFNLNGKYPTQHEITKHMGKYMGNDDLNINIIETNIEMSDLSSPQSPTTLSLDMPPIEESNTDTLDDNEDDNNVPNTDNTPEPENISSPGIVSIEIDTDVVNNGFIIEDEDEDNNNDNSNP